MLFPGHPRSRSALPVLFCESPAPGGSVTISHRAEKFQAESPRGWRTARRDSSQPEPGFPCTEWTSFSSREFTHCHCGLCAGDIPMAHATICPHAIPFQELLESWSRHRLQQLNTWKMGGGRTGQRDVVIARGRCDRRVKRRSNSSLCVRVWKWALPTATTAPAKARVTTAMAPEQAEFSHPPQGTVCFRFPVLKSEFKRGKTPSISF